MEFATRCTLYPHTDYRPGAKIRKMLKQELLSATTSVLREAARLGAQLIVGDGQGAVAAAALARPRVVEAGLCSRSVQSDEGSMFSRAWHTIRAVVINAPKLYGSLRAERIFEAVPTFSDPARPDETFIPTVVVLPADGPSEFASDFNARREIWSSNGCLDKWFCLSST